MQKKVEPKLDAKEFVRLYEIHGSVKAVSRALKDKMGWHAVHMAYTRACADGLMDAVRPGRKTLEHMNKVVKGKVKAKKNDEKPPLVIEGKLRATAAPVLPRRTKGNTIFYFTSAQNNTPLHDKLWQNMLVMAKHDKASIHVSRFAYVKRGLGASYRFGIDETDEFGITVYALQNDNGMNYDVRWTKPNASSPVANSLNTKLDPDAYYGLSSDFNKGAAYYGMLTHTHRFSKDTEIVTKVRAANYSRDQRATLWSTPAASQPDGKEVTLDSWNNATVIVRGFQPKKQDMQTITAQSDLNTKFSALGFAHTLQAGVDFAHEKKQVYTPVTALQGGIVPARPNTTAGTPYDGASIDESVRSYRANNDYVSKAYGGYVQDLIEVAPMWKVLAGLRYDHLLGDYNQYTAASNTAVNPLTVASYQMKVSEVSKRAAVLFQPDAQWSFHLMGATSFNTSGDAYSLSAANADIPPEKSVNVELGAKWDSADGKLSLRASAFRNTKLHERNTDPLNTGVVTLSGKRHAAGLDFDVVGRITPEWEVFGNFTWMPVSKIDISSATSGEKQGDRPSLSPRYSGSIWTAYQVLPQLRLGGGLNARSSQTPNRNPVGIVAPKFVTADAMAEYTVVPETLSFKLYVSNIANKLYADQLYTSFYVPGTGRVTTLTGTYKF